MATNEEDSIESANTDDLESSVNDDQDDNTHLIHQTPRWWHCFRPRIGLQSTHEDSDENPSGTLGTLNGVIIPVCLSMFSSLLFLRVGYIIGNAGLLFSLLQLLLAYLILCCTVCSISAIATNGAVKGGGVYFMISRTLGPQLGGAVGIIFYMANIVSGALYASGFTETLVANYGPKGKLKSEIMSDSYWFQLGISSAVLGACLFICLVGAKAFSKCTIIFAILLLVALSDLGLSFTQDIHVSQSKIRIPFRDFPNPKCGNCGIFDDF